jgi:hypothetical protein
LNKFDFISNELVTTVRDINHYMPTKYCKSGRLLLGEIYELIKENEAKFLLQISTSWYQIHILQYLCEKKMLNYGEITMRHINIFMEIH